MPHLLAVCRVARLLPDSGTVGVTAIDKRPVDGPVGVRDLGLYGDVQADRAHHGGLDKALYAYSEEDALWWAERLDRPMAAGRFGENLRIEGLAVSGAVIGEHWRIGASVELEVTMPRTPCATFQRTLGEPQWVKTFRPGGAHWRVPAGGAPRLGRGGRCRRGVQPARARRPGRSVVPRAQPGRRASAPQRGGGGIAAPGAGAARKHRAGARLRPATRRAPRAPAARSAPRSARELLAHFRGHLAHHLVEIGRPCHRRRRSGSSR